MCCLNIFNCTKKPKAHVVDGKLVLSLPGALTPVVWQTDLAKTSTSSIEVIETSPKGAKKDEAKNLFELVLKDAAGEQTNIASFENRNMALAAMITASKALANAKGKIAPATVKGADGSIHYLQPKKSIFRWLVPIILILIIFFLLFVIGKTAQQAALMSADGANALGSYPSQAQAPTSQAGVPMSADEFLRGR